MMPWISRLRCCAKHGEFEQTPDKHLKLIGCPGCGAEKLYHARNALAVGEIWRAELLIDNISHPSLSAAKAVLANEMNTKRAIASESTTKPDPPTKNKRHAYKHPPINQLDPLSALILQKAIDAISENDFELAEKVLSRDFPLYFEESKRKVVVLLASKKARVSNTRK